MASKSEHYYSEYQKNLEAQQNLKYKNKYKKLKRIIKDIVIENAALCDQVAQMQENLVVVKEERLFLLRKLCQLQGEMETVTMAQKMSSNHSGPSASDGVLKKSSSKKKSFPNPEIAKWKPS